MSGEPEVSIVRQLELDFIEMIEQTGEYNWRNPDGSLKPNARLSPISYGYLSGEPGSGQYMIDGSIDVPELVKWIFEQQRKWTREHQKRQRATATGDR